ncbi:SDR family oxidoreductase [Roseococcus sp. YIM B11640]|uniref:SDR family oxidoreductase n=1 Tax=Roseococcus sp. YIM B11640 TaxID=3133973 RepID=UPI003C7D57C6
MSLLPIPPEIPRLAVITGGARRLGRGIALSLARAGFDLAIHHRASAAEAATLAEEAAALGRRCRAFQADLMREEEVRGLWPRILAEMGAPGVLVNNASAFERDEWNDATREGWDEHMEPNLRAPFVLMQDFARHLPEGSQGAIVNMLDQRVKSLTPHFVSYTVSKAGLWALTQQMALALAPRIRVNGIGPGPALPSPRQSQAQFDRQCASVPLGHGTSPEEIGSAVVALLALPSVTGQILCLDGGQHLQWAPRGGIAPEE